MQYLLPWLLPTPTMTWTDRGPTVVVLLFPMALGPSNNLKISSNNFEYLQISWICLKLFLRELEAFGLKLFYAFRAI